MADITNSLMLSVPRLFSYANWSSFRLPAYTEKGVVWYAIFFVPIAILIIALYRWDPFALRRPTKFITHQLIPATTYTLAALIGIVCLHPFSAPRPDGRLKIDFLDGHHDHGAWRLFLHLEGIQQIGLIRNLSTAIDAQCAAGARNQKQQRNPRIAHDVAQ